MLLRKIFLPLENVANYFVKATFAYKPSAGDNIEIYLGASIATSAAAAECVITTQEDHGLTIGDPVRVLGHVNIDTPSLLPLIDPENVYLVLTTPTATTLSINLTTTDAGARGYIGRKVEDYVVAADCVGVLYGEFTTFSPQEDRVG